MTALPQHSNIIGLIGLSISPISLATGGKGCGAVAGMLEGPIYPIRRRGSREKSCDRGSAADGVHFGRGSGRGGEEGVKRERRE